MHAIHHDSLRPSGRRQPIAALEARGALPGAELAAIEASVAAEVAAAVAEAEAGPWEPVEDLAKDVYTEPAAR